MAQLQLTDATVRSLKGAANNPKFFDTKTPGFGIRCGLRRKTWIVMRGRNRELVTIGHYPAMGVAEARTAAKKLLAADPEPKATRITWETARDEFLEQNYQDSSSDWPYIVRLTLKKHFRSLDHRQLGEVTDQDVSRCLEAISGHSARLHAFRIARTFLNWATKPPRRYVRFSPMQGYDAPGTDRKRARILTDDELRRVWNASFEGSRRVFRLLILWGTRSKETAVLERAWRENGVLTIPGAVTKNGRDHAIPILPLAEEVLSASLGDFYFPGQKEGPLRAGSLHELRRDIQKETGVLNWGAHDLRRTFRSNMARLGVPRDLCELLLNHAPAVLDEIYDRYSYLQEKREALAKYEAFLLKLTGSG